jgi:hypothetical protein
LRRLRSKTCEQGYGSSIVAAADRIPFFEVLRADRDQAVAFRLNGHNLAARLPAGSLLEAAASCGIQDSPPGSAALGLHARVEGLTPAQLFSAVSVDRALLQTWSMRGAPFLYPSRDWAVFTLGLLPGTEASLHAHLAGLLDPMIEEAGMTVTELVELAAKGVYEALDGRVLTKRELGVELGRRMPPRLGPWFEPDTFYAANLVRLVALRGLLCFAPRVGNESSFVRTDQWLDRPTPMTDAHQARAELVRRYLRCYGPSVPDHFAEWAGMTQADARSSWGLLEADLLEVSLGGGRCWLHRGDLPDFESPRGARGVRLLPPHDMFLFQRDRVSLIPEVRLHKVVWRSSGNPGVVLVDGRVAAVWRPQKKGGNLVLTVAPFGELGGAGRQAIEAEAADIAPFRGASTVQVTFGDRP